MNPILKIRELKGWTQQDCADRAGCFVQQWGYWERKPEMLDLLYPSLRRIAKVFGMTHIHLLLERHQMGEDDA